MVIEYEVPNPDGTIRTVLIENGTGEADVDLAEYYEDGMDIDQDEDNI